MRITVFSVENVKRVKAVQGEIDDVLVVAGRNAQGKSSVLDGICYALFGKHIVPPNAIRDGQSRAKASVHIRSDDPVIPDLVVTRYWEGEKSWLEVKEDNPNFDAVAPSPQALLDSIVSRFAYDPLSFCRGTGTARVAEVKKALDPTEGDVFTRRRQIYEARRAANRELADAKASLAEAKRALDTALKQANLDAPPTDADIERAAEALSRAKTAESLVSRKARCQEDISRLEREVAELEAALNAKRELLRQERDRLAAIEGALKDSGPELSSHDCAMRLAQMRAILQASARVDELAKAFEKAESAAMTWETELTTLDRHIEDMLATKMGEIGASLNLGDDDIYVNGRRFDLLSESEQIRVAVAIGSVVNKRLRVVFIREGSLLDKDSLRDVVTQAEQFGLQVFVERVGTDDTGLPTLIIEDGEVVGGSHAHSKSCGDRAAGHNGNQGQRTDD